MSSTVARTESPRHRLSHEMGRPRMAKANLMADENAPNLADFKSVVGHAVQRALSLAGLSVKEACALLGKEQAQVSRWISGQERAQMDAIFAVPELQMPMLQAFAEMVGEPVEVTTEIRLKRRA